MDSVAEEWRPVPGWEGWYEVSDLGRVRNIATGHRRTPGKVLVLSLSNRGRWTAHLFRHYEQKVIACYKLVIEAFVGPCPEGHEVHHRDMDHTNDALSNLEYMERREHRRLHDSHKRR